MQVPTPRRSNSLNGGVLRTMPKTHKTYLDGAEEDLYLDEAPLELRAAQSVDPFVAKIQAWKTTPPKSGESWYALPQDWYASFLKNPHNVPEIDTHRLVQMGCMTWQVRPANSRHFTFVPQQAWDALADRYALTGPPLLSTVVQSQDGSILFEQQPLTVEIIRWGEGRDEPCKLPSMELSAATTLKELAEKMLVLLSVKAPSDQLHFLRCDTCRDHAMKRGGFIEARYATSHILGRGNTSSVPFSARGVIRPNCIPRLVAQSSPKTIANDMSKSLAELGCKHPRVTFFVFRSRGFMDEITFTAV